MIRWGVMSTASIGRHAVNPAIQASSNGELVAVASRDAVRARDFAAEHGIPRHHGSYADLLADEEIDAVYVPLPNSLHREWTIRAAEAGKHVLCEKPLGLSEAECREMKAAADAHGVLLMEAFMYRFHPRIDRMLELVQSGAIGTPTLIHAAFTFRLRSAANIRLRPELGGGALMDVGCYCVNVSRTIAGAEPVEVQAFAVAADSGVDARMVGAMRFPGDLLATFECGLDSRRRERVEVGGTDGALAIDDAFLPGTGEVAIEAHGADREPIVYPIEGVDEYRRMVEHIGDCIARGEAPRHGADEAARNLRVIEALTRSARAGGAPVTIAAGPGAG